MWRFLQRVTPLIIILIYTGLTPSFAQVSVNLPSTQGTVNGSGLIPVNVGDLTGLEVTAFQFVISYDPSIIEITGADGAGTLSDGKLLLENTSITGQISVSSASDFDYEGSGVLLNLEVNYLSEGTTTLTLDSFMFNEGTPATTLTNGSVAVTSEGGGGPDPVSLSLPANLSGTANTPLSIPVTVDDVSGKNVSSYEFTFTYNPAVLQVDGVNVANTLSAGATPTTSSPSPGQYVVTWNSGTALSGSGTLIEIETTPIGAGSSSLNLENAVFNAGSPVALVTGGNAVITDSGSDLVTVTLPQTSGSSGDNVLIPLTVGNVTGKNVTSFELTVVYNPAVIEINGVSQDGTLSSGVAPIVNTNTPGRVVVSWASVSALEGGGALLNFETTLVANGVSPLTLESFEFNEGTPETTLTSGSVTVSDSGSNIKVTLPGNLNGERDTQISIPVTTESVSGEGVTSFVFTVSYDDSVIDIVDLNVAGTLIQGNTPTINTDTPGQVIVAYSGTSPIEGAGVLVNLVTNLKSPGSSALSFTSFQYNNGNPPVDLENGRVTIGGIATFVQVVHNSSDAPPFDIYINDQKRVDALSYAGATAFLNLESPSLKIDVVSMGSVDNSQPIASTNEVLENGRDYVIVINGLYSGSGKQALGVVIKESQQEATNENTVGMVMFQGSPDAPPVNAYIVDDTGENRVLTLAKGLSFGESFLTREFEPGIYNIEVTQNNGPRIGIYRADLTRTGGASLLFMIQGFVNPLLGQPDLAMTAYAPDGQGISLQDAVSVSNEDELEVPDAFTIHGNYPNPFNPTTSIRFDLPESAVVHIEVYDLAGRNVMSLPAQQYTAGNNHIAQVDASALASGTYLYRLVAQGAQNTFVQSSKMTLLK